MPRPEIKTSEITFHCSSANSADSASPPVRRPKLPGGTVFRGILDVLTNVSQRVGNALGLSDR
jgi:hypothetical protein